MRPYTPTNLSTEKGFFDLIVKEYPNSKMGSHLFKLKVGDTIDAKGPWPTLAVAPSQFTSIGMIAGGTGITPMYQIIHNVLSGKGNTTSISLLFANNTEEDIIMRKDLEALQSKHSKQFSLHHVISKPSAGWKGLTGHVNADMIKANLPAPGKNIKVLVSGPPPMMEAICGKKDYSSYPPKQGELGGVLKGLSYTSEQVYKF
ncbi:cytochrome-b5 reductase [Angomonas deanei]|nr:cytochrome-b5 reductase [Angomonas deanei]|eukprot:EPY35439.1 cytochrome-b5 reductase [Angomonas deanei]